MKRYNQGTQDKQPLNVEILLEATIRTIKSQLEDDLKKPKKLDANEILKFINSMLTIKNFLEAEQKLLKPKSEKVNVNAHIHA